MATYRASIEEMPTTTSLFVMMGITFGAVGLSHFGADVVSGIMNGYKETLKEMNLTSLTSHFFLVGRFCNYFWLAIIFDQG